MTAPKENLVVWLGQLPCPYQEPAANLAYIEESLAHALADCHSSQQAKPDLILLPELFATGFGRNPEEVAEPMNLHLGKWMQQLARRTHTTVAGTAVIWEKGPDNTRIYRNRMLCYNPEGLAGQYDKQALFPIGNEAKRFTAGRQGLILTCGGWRLKMLICYDLRFPALSANHFQGPEDVHGAYEALVYLASWPQARIAAWNTLLPARAIENRAFVLGVNRVDDPSQAQSLGEMAYHTGQSQALNPDGSTIIGPLSYCAKEWHPVHLSLSELHLFRAQFPFTS